MTKAQEALYRCAQIDSSLIVLSGGKGYTADQRKGARNYAELLTDAEAINEIINTYLPMFQKRIFGAILRAHNPNDFDASGAL
jgi:hypothetical protein